MKTHERCKDGAAQESARGQKGRGTDETAVGRGGGLDSPGPSRRTARPSPTADSRISPLLGFGFGRVTCFAQRSISGRDVNKGLKCDRRVGQPIYLCDCHKENILWSHCPASQDPSRAELPCLPRTCGGR